MSLELLESILPLDYWENEFKYGWKNGEKPNPYLLHFLSDYQTEIGPRVLDIGSGDGRHLLLMAKLGYKMTGLELTKHGIVTTRKRLMVLGLIAELIQGDFHRLPFADNSFETALAVQVLHYNNWCGAQNSFREIARILKPNGLFFFRSRSTQGHWRPTDQSIPDYGITRIETRGPNNFLVMVHDYSLAELNELANDNGLTIIGQPIDEDANGQPGQWNLAFRKKSL